MSNPVVFSVATQSPEETITKYSSTERGLSSAQVTRLLEKYGQNLVSAQSLQWWQLLLRQVKSPFIAILVFAAILAGVLGELIDSAFILVFILINTVLGFFQEYRSEQALKVLQKYTLSHARVLRDGAEQLIPTTELVPGDIVLVEPGDIVPADVKLLKSHTLLVNESVLTGESAPVEKNEEMMATQPKELFEAKNILFSGTSVIRGTAQAIVIATGKDAYVGQIAKLTVEAHHQSSFEKGMQSFSAFVLKLVVITLVFLFLGNILVKPETNIVELMIFSIALATAVIPEALPLVITFSLSKGALKLAKHKVVVKRLSAIEDLGGIEVLCTDKTGTITRNIMTVSGLYAHGGPAHDDRVYYIAALGVPSQTRKTDPFDLAILSAVKEHGIAVPAVKYLSELPFDPQRRRNSVLIEDLATHRKTLVVRGALEAILPHAENLSPHQRRDILRWAEEQGNLGQRVIAVARRSYQRRTVGEYSSELEEKQLEFVGCLSFVDPLKTTAAAALAKAKVLGIQVKILTGDGPAVAGAVAKEVGLITEMDQVTTGAELEAMTPKAQHEAVEKYHVFARVSPQQKYIIIELLKEKHEVGYLGEGINDAPALKAANVSLAVQGASDIAKETADVILLHSSLRVIIDGIELGRGVFANTTKYVRLTMASNFGNFFAVAIASFLIDYLPMLPLQILLVNLLTDFPLIAIATDTVDEQETLRPEKYDLKDFALATMVLGLVSSLFDFLFFGFFSRISPGVLQTNWFIGSILCELILFFSLRTKLPFFKTKVPSKTVLILMVIAAIATVIIPFTQIGQSVFSFEVPKASYMLLTLSLVFAYFVTTEVVKLLYYRTFDKHKLHALQ
jgi:P-type Mg2+ transporter